MFWLDRVFNEASEALKDKIRDGEILLIRDEKTASGRVHVGSMRALTLHAAISERLSEQGIPNVFKFEINDFDPMDGMPSFLDATKWNEHMGKPLKNIPSPEASAQNFAEFFGREYIDAIQEAGFSPEYYRGSELYVSGKMNNAIRLALERADRIRKIYFDISKSKKADDWLPLNVVCENCGKVGTTKVTQFDGELVSYTCFERMVEWARGCGHEGKVSPFNGAAKFPWKVEWAAKWFTLGVDIEGGGKDHYSKGGARDVAEAISREVFEYVPPFGVPNEFFLVGGKKMSSSKGQGYTARDIVELVPRTILRLALFQKDVNQQINFDPAGDTVPVLFDRYDQLAEKYWSGVEDDDSRLFLYAHHPSERAHIKRRFLPRFSQVAFVVQMPHLNIEKEVERMKGEPLTEADKAEIELRAKYALRWLERTASDDYKFTIAKTIPLAAETFNDDVKGALRALRAHIDKTPVLDGGDLHGALHEIRKQSGLDAQQFFAAIYVAFLGKDHGPKAGWFLSVLDREFVLSRLEEVTK